MAWELPVGAIIEGGLDIFKERKNIWETAKKLSGFMRRGTLRIAVFGLGGGVGKTTLGNFLAADDADAARLFEYEPFEKHRENAPAWRADRWTCNRAWTGRPLPGRLGDAV